MVCGSIPEGGIELHRRVAVVAATEPQQVFPALHRVARTRGLRERRRRGDQASARLEPASRPAFRLASTRADAVIVNGGLGPTVDDLSQEVAAEACGVRRAATCGGC